MVEDTSKNLRIFPWANQQSPQESKSDEGEEFPMETVQTWDDMDDQMPPAEMLEKMLGTDQGHFKEINYGILWLLMLLMIMVYFQ